MNAVTVPLVPETSVKIGLAVRVDGREIPDIRLFKIYNGIRFAPDATGLDMAISIASQLLVASREPVRRQCHAIRIPFPKDRCCLPGNRRSPKLHKESISFEVQFRQHKQILPQLRLLALHDFQ